MRESLIATHTMPAVKQKGGVIAFLKDLAKTPPSVDGENERIHQFVAKYAKVGVRRHTRAPRRLRKKKLSK